jgi:hypothetical protein
VLTPSQYLDISSALTAFPLPKGGVRPLEPVPVTNRVTGLQGFADNRVVPYVQNWNLSLQHELVKNVTMEVRYVGSKGTKLRSAKELNTINIFENGILDAFNITALEAMRRYSIDAQRHHDRHHGWTRKQRFGSAGTIRDDQPVIANGRLQRWQTEQFVGHRRSRRPAAAQRTRRTSSSSTRSSARSSFMGTT